MDFDSSDVAEKDVFAMIDQVYDESISCGKIILVGHSIGTMQMFNFLAKASQADHRYIAHMIAMEPCLVA